MGIALEGALRERFTSVISGVTGGIWYGEIPETYVPTGSTEAAAMVLPVCCLKDEGFVTEYDFEDVPYDEGTVTFFVFARSAAAARSIARQIRKEFSKNWNLIALDEGGVVSMLCDRFLVDNEGERDTDGELVFRAEVAFQVRVEWPLA